jgi:hypothetical protein
MGIVCPSKLTFSSSELSQLNWHFIYSVLVLLSLKPFDSKVCLHNFSFWLTQILLSSISTTSSAKSMHQGMSPYISFVISSITKMKIYEFIADPWCNPILIVNASDSPLHILNKVTYFIGTYFFSNTHHMIFLDILSYAFSKSINIIRFLHESSY